MNKEQLVKELLQRVEQADVQIPGYATLRASADYWEKFPDGHSRKQHGSSVEEDLACLLTENLEKILGIGNIPRGISYGNLWRTWSTLNCLNCQPMIINSEPPVLRIWHDSYLRWSNGTCFTNHRDAYSTLGNFSSNPTLEEDTQLVMRPDLLTPKWEAFRKALIFHHPFMACGAVKYFHQMITRHPSTFEEFINLTDDKVMHLNLDKALTLRRMCDVFTHTEYKGPTILEFEVVHNGECYGYIRVSRSCISLTYSSWYETMTLTAAIPEWDMQHPVSLDDHLYRCWSNIATTLLTLAGFEVMTTCIMPYNKDAIDATRVHMLPKDLRVSGGEEMRAKFRHTASNCT